MAMNTAWSQDTAKSSTNSISRYRNLISIIVRWIVPYKILALVLSPSNLNEYFETDVLPYSNGYNI